ncbi:MAG: mechanosensitive ion channel family protein [Flavobacteriales bacterium]|nr:mechanosensitive ion channel family protein [Flavobacteriales bacterium]
MHLTQLTGSFVDNTLIDWLRAAAFIVGGWLVGQVLYRLAGSVLSPMAQRTATRIDDALVTRLRTPVVVLITLLGLIAGYQQLTVSERAGLWIGRGIHVAVALCVTWIVTRILVAVAREVLLARARREGSESEARLVPGVTTAIQVIIWGLGAVVALNNAGYDVGALLAGIGIGGLAMALAAQETVANIFGGITIYADRPFRVGDRVRVDGHDGFVLEVGIRSTRIHSLEGPVVVIPNKKFTESVVENISLEPSRRVRHELGLIYETPPERLERAMEVLREIIEANQTDLEQEHLISFTTFGAYSLNIIFIYFIRKNADIFATQSRIHLEVLRRFHAESLSFAYPTSVELQGTYKA